MRLHTTLQPLNHRGSSPCLYHLHKTFANYNENKKSSDEPPPYHHPYNVATVTKETKSWPPPNLPKTDDNAVLGWFLKEYNYIVFDVQASLHLPIFVTAIRVVCM